MTQMFARSTLTSWDDISGAGDWSNTSGGVSNGTWPGATTDVVFDANSGISRTINLLDAGGAGNTACKSLTTVGANAMTFTGVHIQASTDVNLTGSVYALALSYTGSGPCTLNSGGNTLASLTMNAATMTLGADLTVSGAITTSAAFSAGNHNVTAARFTVVSGSPSITMGSGTWTLTGSNSTVWDINTATISGGTSTIKLTGGSAGTIQFAGGGKTYNNFWNATTGAAIASVSGSNTFNNFKIDAGRTQNLDFGYTQTVTSFTADGTGALISIASTSNTTPATLAKAGGGSVYVDYCSFTWITGSPISTWNARNSVNGGNNSSITFIPGNSSFLQFF